MYDEVAARYDEDRARFAVPSDDLVGELLADRPALRVLDLGCGTGRWLAAQQAHFRGAPIAWLGVYPSPGMLREALAKGLANLVCAPGEALPLRDGALDLVSASYCFHHFRAKDRALDEIARALAPGGRLRMTNLEPSGAEGWWVYELFPETVAIDAARFWPPERIAAALESRGLQVEVRLERGSEEVPAAEALAEAERRVVSELALLDDAAYERGLARLRRVARGPSATVTAMSSRLHLTARR